MGSESKETKQAEAVVITLLLTDLVGSTQLVSRLGDARAARVFQRMDRMARVLLQDCGGREIDKTDGFLFLFDRPIDAVLYALRLHDSTAKLASELEVELSSRAGIHLGELIIHENEPAEVALGAKPIEVEGLAKPMAARIMSLALGGQTLITQSAFDLARRAVVGRSGIPPGVAWRAHGSYLLKGCDEPTEVFEVGVEGQAPLSAPPDTEKARRSVAAADEETLGWRPAVGLVVPQRKSWMLDQKLGEGGFGEVWLAIHQRTKVRRVFKFCFDADRLRSFQRELTLFRLLRDALGDRPDIARLFEVQLDEPPFFLESEFTPSGSLLDWTQKQNGIENLPMETRIRLVRRTARAVAAAHSVGILHKDIKPGNILIYEDEEGEPRPRLADFGIGILTDRGRLDSFNITMVGFTEGMSTDLGSRTGTRMYAPPESLAGQPFTVLGDVYALGVLLYQMVVGDLDRPLAQGWERDIHDPLLREDIGDCVEGDEEQRLGSAQGLAKRLESLPERRRLARRRKVLKVAAAASGVLVLLLGVATVWGTREIAARKVADSLRVEAEIALDKANAVKEILQGMLSSADPTKRRPDLEAGYDVTVVSVLDRAMLEVQSMPADQPEIRAEVLMTLGEAYKNLRVYDMAQHAFDESLELRRSVFEPPHAAIAESLRARAAVLYWRREVDAALSVYEESLSMRRALFPEQSAEVAESLNGVAMCLNDSGRHAEAEGMYRQALTIRRELLTADPAALDPMLVAASENNLALCLERQSKLAEARDLYESSLETARAELGDKHFFVAETLSNLAYCILLQGQSTFPNDSIRGEAERLYRDALAMKLDVVGADHPSIWRELYWLALLTNARGAYEEAEQLGQQLFDLAMLLSDKGEDAQATQLFSDTRRMCVELLKGRPDGETSRVPVLHLLAADLIQLDDLPRAEVALERALELCRSADPQDPPLTAGAAQRLGEFLSSHGKFEDAETLLVEAYEVFDSLGDDTRGKALGALAAVISLYEAWGKPDLAATYQAALTVRANGQRP